MSDRMKLLEAMMRQKSAPNVLENATIRDDRVAYRGAILPLVRERDGTVRPGIPGALHDALSALRTPGDVLMGRADATPEVATNMAVNLGLGAGAARGAGARGGDLGIFAGKNAKTANLAALAEAQTMESAGKSADDIWRATGWGRGADGAWRFEIDDSGTSFDSKAALERSREMRDRRADLAYAASLIANRAAKRGISHEDAVRSIHADGINVPEGALRLSRAASPDELIQRADEAYALAGAAHDPTTFTLGQVMEHGSASRAYPDLKQRPYNIAGVEAGFGTAGGYSPEIDEFYLSKFYDKDERAVGLHELQHAVQQREGFAQGSNPEMAGSQENYLRTSGEVEARNVQTRRNWDAARRREIPPWHTEDYPRDQQIIRRR